MTVNLQADADNVGLSVDNVYEQYGYDWNNWPAAWGAPYDDVDANEWYAPYVAYAKELEIIDPNVSKIYPAKEMTRGEIAEIIYKNVVQIKLQYPNIKNEDAINKFLETDIYENLSSGKLHNDWFNKLKTNNFIDEESGNKISEETIKLLNIQKNVMIKQLINIPNLYNKKNNNLLELSNRAYTNTENVRELRIMV